LSADPDLVANIVRARDLLDDERGEQWSKASPDADAALYDGFVGENDKKLMAVVRAAQPSELSDLQSDLRDQRLKDILPRYKARNFPDKLSDEERAEWEKYRYHALMDGGANSKLGKFMHRLGQLAQSKQGQSSRYLLEELQLYAESIMPITDIE
jgi:exodeoxyribonuclease-1